MQISHASAEPEKLRLNQIRFIATLAFQIQRTKRGRLLLLGGNSVKGAAYESSAPDQLLQLLEGSCSAI